MAAASRRPSRLAVIARRIRIAFEDFVRQDERLYIARPPARPIAPAGAGDGAVADTAVEVAAVIALPKPQARARADRVDPAKKAIATHS